MTDIQGRLAEINKRVSPIFEEHVRLTDAVNKAITLIFAMAAIGILTVIAIAPTEQSLKERALINQESSYVAH
jgi:hypothetical protein